MATKVSIGPTDARSSYATAKFAVKGLTEALPGAEDFQSNAPTTAAEAATIILNGVRENRWRILVGPDAELMDAMVREMPGDAYDAVFIERLMETIG